MGKVIIQTPHKPSKPELGPAATKLAKHREELAQLEQDTVTEFKKTALDAAKFECSLNTRSVLHAFIAHFLSKSIKNIDIITSERLENESDDSMITVVTITLFNGNAIVLEYSKRLQITAMLLNIVGDEGVYCIDGAFGNLCRPGSEDMRILMGLTSGYPLSACSVIVDHFQTFSGIFVGSLESFLAFFVSSMRTCPVDAETLATSDEMDNIWGGLYRK